MGSVLSKFGKARYRLTKAYSSGKVCYPRVSQDYIEKADYYEHPHPPLGHFDEYASPLRKEFYPLIKETMPIELSNVGISTPSTLWRNLEVCDRYFDGNGIPRENKFSELTDKINAYYEHIELLVSYYGKKGILDDAGTVLVNEIAKDGSISIYENYQTPFHVSLAPSPRRKKEIEKIEKKKLKDCKKNFTYDTSRIHVASVDEALLLFRRKKIIIARRKEKLSNMRVKNSFISNKKNGAK